MAKKLTEQNEPTSLIIDKSVFKKVLEEKIVNGEEIHQRQIETKEDFEKMRTDFGVWVDWCSEYLKQSFNKPENEYRNIFTTTGSSIFFGGSSSSNPLERIKIHLKAKLENLRKLLGKTDLLRTTLLVSLDNNVSEMKLNMTEVFIVHGHDSEAKIKTARFIEKLGFKAIILHEQASSGRTIIEKIEEYSNVGFGIVLYTPDDIGSKHEENPTMKSRARQNVVFEHGYLIGKIGRRNVCALVKGEVEKPNDISGVVYVTFDDTDAWHFKVAKELKNSGYNVDMNKI